MRANVIVRLPVEPLHGGAVYHSMCMEGFYGAIPRLTIVAPSTSRDVYGLLRTAAELLDDLSCDSPELRKRKIATYARPDLLVIDELGAERDDLADTVSGLAGRRYDAGLVTLVTTNLPSAAVKARYLTSPAGARLLDRVRMEQGLGGAPGGLPGLVTLSGPSLRGRAQGT